MISLYEGEGLHFMGTALDVLHMVDDEEEMIGVVIPFTWYIPAFIELEDCLYQVYSASVASWDEWEEPDPIPGGSYALELYIEFVEDRSEVPDPYAE